MDIEQIRNKLKQAAMTNDKSAAFMLQIILNAEEIKDMDFTAFCQLVEMPISYRKMVRDLIKVCILLKDQGYEIVPMKGL